MQVLLDYWLTGSVVPLNHASVTSDAVGEAKGGPVPARGISLELSSGTISQLKNVLVEAVLGTGGRGIFTETPITDIPIKIRLLM
jgi:hypothetical protein